MGGGGKKFLSKRKGISQEHLGKAIWNTFSKKHENGLATNREHLLNVVCDNYDEMNNKSIVEMSSLDEYLCTSLRAQKNFEGEKVIKIISSNNVDDNKYKSNLMLKKRGNFVGEYWEGITSLPIPRRPLLFTGPNCDINEIKGVRNLDDIEKESFLEWRKFIAEKEESTGLFVTPYEKNLEFWRQLWRTVERSHLIVEIVDSRDPLFFRNTDLEKYINEIDPFKKIVLLFNKADLLNFELRKKWYDYFANVAPDITVYFFSALSEINKREACFAQDLCNPCILENCEQSSYEGNDFEAEPKSSNYDILSTKQLLIKLYHLAKIAYNDCFNRYIQDKNMDMESILEDGLKNNGESDTEDDSVENGITKVEGHHQNKGNEAKTSTNKNLPIDPLNPGEITIGMVGFPNVGKSSVVNALFGTQKSSISKTPGKTKHIQTLKLAKPGGPSDSEDEYVILCDCPGLVMPSFTSTKEHLLINGVIPIDHYRGNFISAIQVIGERIKEQLYNIYFENVNNKSLKSFDSKAFLNQLCETRHFYQQGKGAIPDFSKAGRMILRDYWSGKLLYCHSPPCDSNISNNSSSEDSPLEQETLDLESDIDMLVLNPNGRNANKEKRKTKRQIRMDQKKLLKGKNILVSQ